MADTALYAAKRAGRDGWVGLTAGNAVDAQSLMTRFKTGATRLLAAGEMCVVTSLDIDAVKAQLG